MAMTTTQAETAWAALPELATFADLEKASVKVGTRIRAMAMRRWMRDNVDAYNERAQRNTVFAKGRDKATIVYLLTHVGGGASQGPNDNDNAAIAKALKIAPVLTTQPKA